MVTKVQELCFFKHEHHRRTGDPLYTIRQIHNNWVAQDTISEEIITVLTCYRPIVLELI